MSSFASRNSFPLNYFGSQQCIEVFDAERTRFAVTAERVEIRDRREVWLACHKSKPGSTTEGKPGSNAARSRQDDSGFAMLAPVTRREKFSGGSNVFPA
jgi:hypothetical protein